jgi:hypothetical protein
LKFKFSFFVYFKGELYALRKGFHIQKTKEDLTFLLDLMDRLVEKKEELKSLKVYTKFRSALRHTAELMGVSALLLFRKSPI